MKNMKYIGMAIMALIFISQSVKAQTPRAGIKGGLNLSTLYIDDVEDENVRAGFHAGVYTQLMLAESFAIQPEINFSTKGAKAEYDNSLFQGESKFNLSYIDLPVLFTVKLGDAADIHLGPYAAYLVGVSTSADGDFGDIENELDRDDYEKWDYGLAAGIGLNFQPVTVGVRYNYGLNEIAKTDQSKAVIGDAKNSVGQVYLALNLK